MSVLWWTMTYTVVAAFLVWIGFGAGIRSLAGGVLAWRLTRQEGIVMRRHVIGIGLLPAIFFCAGFLLAFQTQGDDPAQRIEMPLGQPPPSGVWKQVAEDVRLLLTTDQWGNRRATMYVRIDNRWEAVAMDGPSELAPRVLPAGP